MSPPSSYPFEDPWYRLLRGNQMEDTAVSMAIRNHGLVRSTDQTQSQISSNEEGIIVPQNFENVQGDQPSTSKNQVLDTKALPSDSTEDDWLNDKYDSDQQQHFLDRAVAEAIKKKGLSTLSVDYG